MALQCNIDSRGKARRLRWGIAAVVIAVATAIIWGLLLHGGRPAWIIAGVLFAGGAFMIFEGRAGWCVLRAMGIHTRL